MKIGWVENKLKKISYVYFEYHPYMHKGNDSTIIHISTTH